MYLVKGTYEAQDGKNDITISRTVGDDADLNLVVGEVIYGVEAQCKRFTTHDIFEKIEIPEKVTITKTLLDEKSDDFHLKITVGKKKAS